MAKYYPNIGKQVSNTVTFQDLSKNSRLLGLCYRFVSYPLHNFNHSCVVGYVL